MSNLLSVEKLSDGLGLATKKLRCTAEGVCGVPEGFFLGLTVPGLSADRPR